MRTRTNYIRWNREMERNCLGLAWQTYARNNVSQKNVKNKTDNVEEVKTAEENKVPEEILQNENVDDKLRNSCPEPDISESMTEELQDNISESTDEINLKTFMENAIKENQIHKTNTYSTSKKIHWNEDMLKRCLGTYFSTSPNKKKRRKKWVKKESNMHYDNVESKNEELVSNEISYDNVPQNDYMLGSQIYDGEIIEKANEEDEYYDSTGSESNYGAESNYGERDENEKLNEEFICPNDNNSYEQDNQGNFEKISWSTLSDIDDEGFDKETDSIDENIESDNENVNEDSSDEADSYEDEHKKDSEDSYEDGYENNSEDSYKDGYKNDSEYTYDDGYENDYEDSYTQEGLFSDKYANDNETDQYFNEVTDDNFEMDYQENESLTYSAGDNVLGFNDIGQIEVLELEIENQTINNTDWDNSWDEYDVSNDQSQDIETVDSFIDYGIGQEEYSDYDFDSESYIKNIEYMSDYDSVSRGQSIECRIVT